MLGTPHSATRRDLLYYGTAFFVLCVSIAFEAARMHAGIWRDEATSFFTASQPNVAAVFERVRDTEVNPPLFFIVLHFWEAAFGTSIRAIQTLPLIFGIADLLLTFAIGLRIGGRSCALIALAFAGADSLACDYATEVRMYAQAAFFCLLATFLALRVDGRKRQMLSVACVCVSNILLIYTTYVGVFFIGALASMFAVRRIPVSTKVRFLLVAVGIPILAALPLIRLERAQAASNIVSLASPWHARIESFLSFVERTVPVAPNFRHHELLVALPLSILFIGGTLFAARVPWLRNDVRVSEGYRLTAGIWAIAVAAETAIGLNVARYAAPVVYLGCIALAILIDAALKSTFVKPARTGPAYALAIGAILAIPLALQLAATRGNLAASKSGLSAIAHDYPIARNPDLAFVVAPDYSAQTLAFYERTSDRIFGFVHWDRPDFFDIRDYGKRWADPAAVPIALTRIEALKAHNLRRLGFVHIDTLRANTTDGTAFDKSDTLLDRLRARYTIVARTPYRASEEPATLYIFRL